MKRFLIQIILFISVLAISFYLIFYLADGTTDEYYLKFTTPRQESLIIGSSRAAQDIQPHVLNSQLETRVYNYAFSIVHTPYGASYFNSIKRKLIKKTTNGIFILEVNPWTISSQTLHPEDSLNFTENKSFIEKVRCVNCKPNVEYLMYSYGSSYRKIISDRLAIKDIKVLVDTNGWCKVEYFNPTYSFIKAEKRTIDRYKLRLKDYSGISQTRLHYLKETIQFLQHHGTVYLVRLPVADGMLDIENKLVNDFDLRIENIANMYTVDYLNFMPQRSDFNYIDGHHLDIVSGEAISKYIAEQIKNNKTHIP